MKIEDVRRVLIVGAGTMGQQIGLQCAMHGYNVTLYDIAPGTLEAAMTQIREYGGRICCLGRPNPRRGGYNTCQNNDDQ